MAGQAEDVEKRLRLADGHVREFHQQSNHRFRGLGGRGLASGQREHGCPRPPDRVPLEDATPDALVSCEYDPVPLAAGGQPHLIWRTERKCPARYISRPAVSEKRLSLTPNGNIRYHVKTPYRDGTTRVIFEPLELMAHILVRHPPGDLRSSKLALLPICHRKTGGAGAEAPSQSDALSRRFRPQQ